MKRPAFRRGMIVRIKEGWDSAGRVGTVLALPILLGQYWVPVLWEDEKDPDFYEAAGLERDDARPLRAWPRRRPADCGWLPAGRGRSAGRLPVVVAAGKSLQDAGAVGGSVARLSGEFQDSWRPAMSVQDGMMKEITDDWLSVFEQHEDGGLKSIFFRLALHTLPEGVDPSDPRVVAALEKIREANPEDFGGNWFDQE